MSEATATVTAREYTNPGTVSPEVWEQLNKLQHKQAVDAYNANKLRAELEEKLYEIVAKPAAEQPAQVALFIASLEKEKEKRRLFLSFLVGQIVSATKSTATLFRETLTAWLAANVRTDPEGNSYFVTEKFPQIPDPNAPMIQDPADPENPDALIPDPTATIDDPDGTPYLFEPIAPPEPTEKKAKANEITEYLQKATFGASLTTYSENIKNLAANEIADIFTLSIGLLNFLFAQFAISFPENPLPKSAANFIQMLIAVRPSGVFEFFMKDAELMAKSGVQSRTTINGGRNALIQWQDDVGVGLVEIVNWAGSNTQSPGTKYILHIAEILAGKALVFIRDGISVADAQTAVTAVSTNNEKQVKLLTAETIETAKAVMEETSLEVESLPNVSPEMSASAKALRDAAETAKLAKVTEAQAVQEKKQTALSGHLQAISNYRAAADKTPELFEAYIQARLAEVRFDKTALLSADEAKGKLETAYNEIETLLIYAFALCERISPEESKAQRNALANLGKAISKVPTV